MSSESILLERCKVPSSLEELHVVEALIDKVCMAAGVSEESFGNVLIAVTEAFNNAVIHGSGNNSDLSVEICVTDSAESLKFLVLDEGEGFDFDSVDDPTAPENIEKENGRGIYLMRHLADEVVYTNGGKSVELVFLK